MLVGPRPCDGPAHKAAKLKPKAQDIVKKRSGLWLHGRKLTQAANANAFAVLSVVSEADQLLWGGFHQ